MSLKASRVTGSPGYRKRVKYDKVIPNILIFKIMTFFFIVYCYFTLKNPSRVIVRGLNI